MAVLQLFSVSCCRCAKTYGNYLSYARVGCLICRQPDAVFKEDVLKRARVAIQKQLLFMPRPKMWIRLSVLQRMVPLMIESPLLRTTIAWILTSYAFMLRRVFIAFAALGRLPSSFSDRVPSECLPIVTSVGECDYGPAQQHQAELHVLDDRIVLCLKTRKNRPLGARLVCAPHVCIMHGPALVAAPAGWRGSAGAGSVHSHALSTCWVTSTSKHL